jgi:zeta-carotene isomerase
VHLWETGIIRITRHPQAVGQAMWSAAHLAMVGSTFAILTNALLVGHHAFACWNGDRRLLAEHGDDFLKVKARTSTFPFAAIADGRQTLPPDYWKEFVRAPYVLIAVGTIGAYLAHPYVGEDKSALVRLVIRRKV